MKYITIGVTNKPRLFIFLCQLLELQYMRSCIRDFATRIAGLTSVLGLGCR